MSDQRGARDPDGSRGIRTNSGRASFERLTAYLDGLTVSQGAGAGDPLRLLPWQRRFLRGFLAADGDVALTIARGGGKTTLLAAVGCAFVSGPLRQPRGEVVLCASSLNQARIAFDHALAFLDATPGAEWRIQNTQQFAVLEHRETKARLRCIGSDPKRAHGLAPALVLADEPAQWPHTTATRMLAALTTSMGKIPGSRMVAIGTRPDSTEHWFAKMLDGGAAYSQAHSAPKAAPPFQFRTWKRANPSLSHMPDLVKRVRAEADEARVDSDKLASFRAYRLNQGTADIRESLLLEADEYRRHELAEPLAEGEYVLGLDLGTSAAMSAAAAYWPDGGRLDALACFPAEPELKARGLSDGVGNLYAKMHDRGELMIAGLRVSDIGALLSEVLARWGRPGLLVCDRWREADLREHLAKTSFPRAELVVRGQGYRDGGEDVRSFRTAFAGGQVSPERSLLLRAAVAGARTVSDPAGNQKLAKGGEGRRVRARDDAAAAAILAVAEGRRRAARARPRRLYHGAV